MRLKNISIQLIIILFMISCDSVETSLINNVKGLIPLNNGNSWKYDLYEYANGEEYFNRTIEINISDSIVSTINGNDFSCYSINFIGCYRFPRDNYLVVNLEDGLYTLGKTTGFSSTTIEENLLLKYPINQGDSFITDNPLLGNIVITCSDSSRHISTPFSDFSCIVYNYLDITDHGDYIEKYYVEDFYAKNIGYIGSDVYYMNPYDDSDTVKSIIYKIVLTETNLPIP